MTLQETANKHIRDVVTLALEHAPDRRALVVYDERSTLAKILAEAYRTVLSDAEHIDFYATEPEEVIHRIAPYTAGDLIVLVQSSSFRLDKFRFRIELFRRGLKVIEHPHVGRMKEDEVAVYIDALAYDRDYYRTVGPKLKEKIDRASRAIVRCPGTELVYDSVFESAKLNIGDYTGMKNIGGQFPIGEVFTEPKDMSGVNGTVKLCAFGDQAFSVNTPPEPITVVIEKGILTRAIDATPAFEAVLEQIRADEEVWVRELGFGMNRAFTRDRRVTDVGSYERMCGIHLSLGAKHTVYAKPGFRRTKTRYHVDVFAAVDEVELDGEIIFKNGTYTV